MKTVRYLGFQVILYHFDICYLTSTTVCLDVGEHVLVVYNLFMLFNELEVSYMVEYVIEL